MILYVNHIWFCTWFLYVDFFMWIIYDFVHWKIFSYSRKTLAFSYEYIYISKIIYKPTKEYKLVNLWNPIKTLWNVSIFHIFIILYFPYISYFLWIHIGPWLFWSTAMIRFTSLYPFSDLQMKPTLYSWNENSFDYAPNTCTHTHTHTHIYIYIERETEFHL